MNWESKSTALSLKIMDLKWKPCPLPNKREEVIIWDEKTPSPSPGLQKMEHIDQNLSTRSEQKRIESLHH